MKYYLHCLLICWVTLQPLSGEAFKLQKNEAQKYRELNKACLHFVPNKWNAMELTVPQFLLLIGSNPALAQWLNGMINRNKYWSGSLICHAERWYRLSQNHQEFVQTLASITGINLRLMVFRVKGIEDLLTNSPLTARVIHDFIKGGSRLALELFNNIHAIADYASQVGDAVMAQHLRVLAVWHASISELFVKLNGLKCHNLSIGLIRYYILHAASSSHSLNLTEALQNLADNHPKLLQAINNQGNTKQEINSLTEQLALEPKQAEIAARQALGSQQTAATPCPYCLKVFFVALGIGHVLSQTK